MTKGFRLSEGAFAAFKARGPLPPLPAIPVFTPFLGACDAIGLRRPEQEVKFHPHRRWRFDYCWVAEKIALEIEGGAWTRGRHTRGVGFRADLEKYNAATLLGFRLIRVMPDQLDEGAAMVRLLLLDI